MPGNSRRGPYAMLGRLALVVVVLWFGSWPIFGGASPLQIYRLDATPMLSGNEARLFLGAFAVQIVVGAYLALRLAPTIGRSDRILGALLERPGRFYFAMALFGAALAYFIGAIVLGHTPYSEDEKTYLFQARLLSSGHLTMAEPDLSEAFMQPFIVAANGRWSGQYFWAQPALLALGTLVRAPYLVPASEVFVSVLFGARLAHAYARDARAGLAAALLLATSPILILTGATLHNANLATACAAVSLWAIVVSTRRRSVAATAALALSTGIALHNRPLEHAALLAGAAVVIGWVYRRALGALVRRFAPAVLLVLPFVVLHLPLNRAISGSYLHGGYWLFNDARGWRTFGFGTGPFGYEYTVATAVQKTLTSTLLLFFYTTGSPLAFAATAPAFARARRSRRLAAPLAFAAATLAVHLFVPFHSIRSTGPVYDAPLALVLAVWIGVALAGLHARAHMWCHPLARHIVPAAMAAQISVALITFWPSEVAELARAGEASRRCTDALTSAGIRRALVFVQTEPPHGRPRSWTFHPPNQLPDFEHDELLFAHFTSADMNQRVARRYAGDRPLVVEWCTESDHATIASYDPVTGAIGVISGPPPAEQ